VTTLDISLSINGQYSDMPTEMGSEAVEIVTMALDKFQANKNYEVSCF